MENDENTRAIAPEDLEQVAGGVNGGYFRYTVVKGDTLSRIARRFKTTVDTLVRINDIKDPNKIYVGQVLFIPYPD